MRFWIMICGLALCLFTPILATANPNICRVLKAHPSWQQIAESTSNKWGVPVPVQMAIMRVESNFKAHAKNKRSSAKGFAQVVNKTWRAYRHSTHAQANRSSFAAASNFIGWYAQGAHNQLGISPNNAYQLYIAYHNGNGGYKKAMHSKHAAIKKLAHHVQQLANIYQTQIASC